jgi:polysaccharide chain length determinant protein (PEP-CTERM system associated)
MLGHRQLNPEDYMAILRRRLWLILLCGVLGAVGVYLYSLKLPNVYTSDTLVMVEMPNVPENYVRPLVSSEQFDQRLGTMREQILSRSVIEPIIKHLGLYKEEVGGVPMEDLVERLRKAITVRAVRSAAESSNVTGFHISFTANDPRLAQQVCSEILTVVTEENFHLRENRSSNTKDFLKDELQEAKLALDAQEAKLTEFKRQYLGQLPGQQETNLNILLGLNTQLQGATQELNRAYQDKLHAESLLAQQIEAWELSKTGTNPQTLEQQLTNLQSELVTLEGRYTKSHPDVIKKRNDIEQLKRKIAVGSAPGKSKPGVENTQKIDVSEPPHIQRLRNEIYSYQRIIDEKTQQKAKVEGDIQLYRSRVQMSPLVEQKYKDLSRGYETAVNFYNDLLSKKTQAQMAANLEHRQQNEQFRVMDPPNLPQSPSSPDRQLFAAGGLGGGLGVGLVFALLLEMRDRSIRTEEDVELFLRLPTLALVPSVGPANGKEGFWKRAKKRPDHVSTTRGALGS